MRCSAASVATVKSRIARVGNEANVGFTGRGRPQAVAAATPRTSTSRTSTCDTRPSRNSTSTSRTRAASLSPSESASQGKRRKTPAQFPCCGSKSTYKPENHFQNGTCLDNLFHRIALGESDLIGCGYCPCEESLYDDQGKAFVGRLGIIDHILKAHCQPTKNPPMWKYNNVLRNVISREPNFQKRLFKLLESKGFTIFWIPLLASAPSENCQAAWHLVQGLQSLAGLTKGNTELDDNTKGRITKKLEKSFIITSLPTGLLYNPEELFRNMGASFPDVNPAMNSNNSPPPAQGSKSPLINAGIGVIMNDEHCTDADGARTDIQGMSVHSPPYYLPPPNS